MSFNRFWSIWYCKNISFIKKLENNIADLKNIQDEDLRIIYEIQRTFNLKNRIGTRGFMAPETLFNSYFQGKPVDLWAIGIIFLSFLWHSNKYIFF